MQNEMTAQALNCSHGFAATQKFRSPNNTISSSACFGVNLMAESTIGDPPQPSAASSPWNGRHWARRCLLSESQRKRQLSADDAESSHLRVADAIKAPQDLGEHFECSTCAASCAPVGGWLCTCLRKVRMRSRGQVTLNGKLNHLIMKIQAGLCLSGSCMPLFLEALSKTHAWLSPPAGGV